MRAHSIASALAVLAVLCAATAHAEPRSRLRTRAGATQQPASNAVLSWTGTAGNITSNGTGAWWSAWGASGVTLTEITDCPDGLRCVRVAGLTNAHYIYDTSATIAAGGALYPALWVRKVDPWTPGGAVGIQKAVSPTTYGQWTIDPAGMTSGVWYEATPATSAAWFTQVHAWIAQGNGYDSMEILGTTATSVTMDFARPYVSLGGYTTATQTKLVNGRPFCVRADIIPGATGYDSGATHGAALSVGNGVVNALTVYAKLTTRGNSRSLHYDAAGGYVTLDYAMDDTIGHRIWTCEAGGTLHVYLSDIDGARAIEPAFALGGGGVNGAWAPSSTVYVGATEGIGSNAMGGAVSNIILQKNSADPSKIGYVATSPTRVVALGDSITAGWYPAKLNGLLGTGYQVINDGISGEATTETILRWPSVLASLRSGDWLVILLGTNDVRRGYTAAATYANLNTMAQAAYSAGVHVIVSTILPCRGAADMDAGKQTVLQATNTLIAGMSNVTIYGGYAAFGDTDPTYLKAAWDVGDGLHPNATGKTAFATAIKGIIAP